MTVITTLNRVYKVANFAPVRRSEWQRFLLLAYEDPTAETTYYMNALSPNIGLNESPNIGKIVVPNRCIIKRVYLNGSATTGSSGASNFYLRVNNTTDYLISDSVNFGADVAVYNTDLRITLTQGQSFEFKWVTPDWVIDHLENVVLWASVYLEWL